jgi:hypothetical protein
VLPAGTGTTIREALQLVGIAAVPLKLTVLVPWVAPKLVPVMVTEVPTGPELGLNVEMLGEALPLTDLKAAALATQPLEGDIVQVAAIGPATTSTLSASA